MLFNSSLTEDYKTDIVKRGTFGLQGKIQPDVTYEVKLYTGKKSSYLTFVPENRPHWLLFGCHVVLDNARRNKRTRSVFKRAVSEREQANRSK